MPPNSSERPDERVIGPVAALWVVAGSMLGVGIFLVPPLVAAEVPSTLGFFGVWLLGAVIAASGAVAFAELGAMLPRAGGDFVYHREAFGPSVAFASGQVLFVATFAGSLAAMSVALCEFQVQALLGVDLPNVGPITGVQAGALVVIAGITAMNAAGARVSVAVQALTTVLPVTLLAALAAGALVVTGGPSPGPGGPVRAGSLADAFLGVYFAYAGWPAVVYVAGEVRDPARTVPLALFGGTALVATLYLLLCAGFLAVLGWEGLASSGEAGTAMARALGGPDAGLAMTAVIAVAVVASINGVVLGGSRVALAMARVGAFPSFAARTGHSGAPVPALWLHAAVAGVLVLSGGFAEVLRVASAAMLLTGSLTVAALFVLRWRWPERDRPYRATGHPWLPALYVVASVAVLAIDLATAEAPGDVVRALLGVGLLVAAFAAHRVLAVSR